MKTLIISSKPSRSAIALAQVLGIRKLATSGVALSRPVKIINWGCGTKNFGNRYRNRLRNNWINGHDILNTPANISIATNKLLTFQVLDGHEDIPIPEFTTDPMEAAQWGTDIVERHSLTGHSGEGIVICPNNPEQDEGILLDELLEDAPLYVKYVKKKHEYRVHVIGEHTDVQQKRKRQETPNEEVDYQVRNLAGGWVYCREELAIPEGLQDLAIRTVRALDLDFGAVDIIWNQKENRLTVLEVNTAPGLEGQTLTFYAEHLRGLI